MPSAQPLENPPAAPALAEQLAQALRALWLATLSLMTAFMQTRAPAHRLLIARRIARNLRTLAEQGDCFGDTNRARFARLADQWQARAAMISPEGEAPRGGRGLLHALRAQLGLAR